MATQAAHCGHPSPTPPSSRHRSAVSAQDREALRRAPWSGLSDGELVAWISAREPAALDELYDRHAGMLLALARRILGSSEDAEEILQEVLLQIWVRAGSYDSRRSAVATWLGLITRSRAIDRLRSRRTVEQTLAGLVQERPPTHTSPTAAREILSQQRRRRVRQALASLPDEQKMVLELSYYRGLSQSQIARVTGAPVGTVKTRTVLAMKKLRRALRAELSELV